MSKHFLGFGRSNSSAKTGRRQYDFFELARRTFLHYRNLMFQVVILSYNHPEITARCIRSVLKHNLCPILVHNGSEKKHSLRLKQEFPTIKHHELETNSGYTVGANSGINLGCTSAPWVLFLTNDCELLAGPQIPSGPGIYAAHILRKNGIDTEACGGIYDPLRGTLRHAKTLAEFGVRPRRFLPYIPGHAFLVDAQTWRTLGGFDEGFFTYLEDVDLSLRAFKRGIRLDVLGDFKILHAGGRTCRKDRVYSGFYFQRNRRELMRRYSSRPLYSQGLWLKETLSRCTLQIARRDWVGVRYSLRLAGLWPHP